MLLTMLNILVVYWENYLRLTEFKHRLSYILNLLKSEIIIFINNLIYWFDKVNNFPFQLCPLETNESNYWSPDQYPNLFTPNSPAVSLQWTIRDGKILNLPTALLAKGDVIILRPGQLAPAHVKILYPAASVVRFYWVIDLIILSCKIFIIFFSSFRIISIIYFLLINCLLTNRQQVLLELFILKPMELLMNHWWTIGCIQFCKRPMLPS